MRVFKTKAFTRFSRREHIRDGALIEAADRVGRGLIDADLGGGLIKQRVARQGEGRRGGYRLIVAFRAGDRMIFLFGFAKSERANVDAAELSDLRDVADTWLAADAATIEKAKAKGLLIEVQRDE